MGADLHPNFGEIAVDADAELPGKLVGQQTLVKKLHDTPDGIGCHRIHI
jgi:hypothetical protein